MLICCSFFLEPLGICKKRFPPWVSCLFQLCICKLCMIVHRPLCCIQIQLLFPKTGRIKSDIDTFWKLICRDYFQDLRTKYPYSLYVMWSRGISWNLHMTYDDIFSFLFDWSAHFGEVQFAENPTWIDPVVPRLWTIKGFSED